MSWNVYIDKFIPMIFPLQSVPKKKFLKLVKSSFGIFCPGLLLLASFGICFDLLLVINSQVAIHC